MTNKTIDLTKHISETLAAGGEPLNEFQHVMVAGVIAVFNQTAELNVDIRKKLIVEIHKYVIDETGYLISLPDDVIKGILELVRNSSLTVEEPATWYNLEEHGPPADDVSVITWNGHDLAFDYWSNKESENLNVERMLAALGDGDDGMEFEPRKVTHWMYKPTPPKE